ncbi:MAG: hypothetical protein HY657_00545 [Acidobacteria bacterium]|nr:hypothetical protein [Acidobacteriota bacterium]
MIAWLVAGSAAAQTPDQRPVRRLEIEAGGGWLAGAGLGSQDANLTANSPVRQPFRLFTTDTRVAGAPALLVRAGFALNRRFGVEGSVTLSRPQLRTSVSGDVEEASALAIVERVDQYFFEGSVVFMLEEWGMGGRTVPFVAGGAGYLRQLHEGLTVVEQGHVYHVGGGLKHWLVARDSGRIRALGLRADARLSLLVKGLSFDSGPRPHPAISGSLFIGF